MLRRCHDAPAGATSAGSRSRLDLRDPAAWFCTPLTLSYALGLHLLAVCVKASGEPVLDVGCGTGRLLLDFLAQGITIDGVDNSPEMLELCRHKAQRLGLRPALFQQPMQDLQLPHAYRTIIVPPARFSWLPI